MALEQPVTDPVCGMKVNPATAKGGSAERAGTTYYFCGPHCRQRFTADPAKYLSRDTAAPAAAKEWVCPMHPEIVRSQPGPCPICAASCARAA